MLNPCSVFPNETRMSRERSERASAWLESRPRHGHPAQHATNMRAEGGGTSAESRATPAPALPLAAAIC